MNELTRQEFLTFVAARTTALLQAAYALTGDQHAAEDLLQGALEKAVPRWRRLTDPEGYIRRTMYHDHISWWRRQKRRPERLTAELPERITTHDSTDSVDNRHALRGALLSLPPKQRAVLVLRYLEDRSEAEVAELLGCSRSTVSSQANKALAKMRIAYPGFTDMTTEVS